VVVAVDRLFLLYEFDYNKLRRIHIFLDLLSGLSLDGSFDIFRLAKMYFWIGKNVFLDWRIGKIQISDWRIGET
jgi:hypothetical protein